MKLIDVKPPVAAGLLLGASIGLHHLLPLGSRGNFALPTLGTAAAVLGLGSILWSWGLFRRRGTSILPTHRATALVTSGPFRFSRNPMYAGAVLILAGISLWFGSWPMVIPPLGFLILVSLVHVPFEERQLRDAFGEAYAAYVRKTRRWL